MIRFADTAAEFAPGDVIRHCRYEYRGVIVAVDCRCQASSEWYLSNRSQPDQNQPWYHVLVDGQATATYAAQCNLQLDPSGEPVDHPLVEQYFDAFAEGRYQRNEQAWNGW